MTAEASGNTNALPTDARVRFDFLPHAKEPL